MAKNESKDSVNKTNPSSNKEAKHDLSVAIMERIVNHCEKAGIQYDSSSIIPLYQRIVEGLKLRQRQLIKEAENSENAQAYLSSEDYISECINAVDTITLGEIEYARRKSLDNTPREMIKDEDIKLPDEFIITDYVRSVLKEAIERKNLYIYGPAGAGKSTMLDIVSMNLNLPSYYILAKGLSYVIGSFDKRDEVESLPLYKAMKNGGVIEFDEVQQYNAETIELISSIFKNRFCTFANGETLYQHPDCIIMVVGLKNLFE